VKRMGVEGRRARIGIHVDGTGVGGVWRYVHSLLAHVNLEEFDVVLFSGVTGVYDRRPEVQVCPTPKRAGTMPAVARSVELFALRSDDTRTQPVSSRRGVWAAVWRGVVPEPVKLLAGYARSAWALARAFREYPVDVMHLNRVGCDESPLGARMAGVRRVVGTFHIDSTYDLHKQSDTVGHRLMERVSNRCLTRAIGVSRNTAANWLRRDRLDPARVMTIYNGIDPTSFRRRSEPGAARASLGLDPRRLTVGAVGRLDEVKGFAYLIEALGMLSTRELDVQLVIVGSGPLRDELEGDVVRLGLAGRVVFAGQRTDVQGVYDALDVLAMPSVCESFGYVALEAMACGLAVVGTTTGGIPEVVAHGETGLLVRPRDSVGLAVALGRVLSDRELRRRMGDAGRRRVMERFTEREMVARTIEVYRDILRQHA